jgi:hypothetical protein
MNTYDFISKFDENEDEFDFEPKETENIVEHDEVV